MKCNANFDKDNKVMKTLRRNNTVVLLLVTVSSNKILWILWSCSNVSFVVVVSLSN